MPQATPTHYQPYFCEENTWWLNQASELRDLARVVVFITNPSRTVALGSQRAGGDDGIVIWDYHVVLLADDQGLKIFDLDCTAGYPLPLASWMQITFDCFQNIPSRFKPSFRLITGARFHAEFASDRRHMKGDDGAWLHPPPPWNPIGHGHNLEEFLRESSTLYGPLISRQHLMHTLTKTI